MPSEMQALDFEQLFNATPGRYLLLDPELTIVGVNDAYLAATMTQREGIVGKPLFEVFPDNPEDPKANGVENLRASLMRVLQTSTPDRMAIQKYDIRRPPEAGGGFEQRYWSPLNVPVLRADRSISHVIHSVQDVTDIVAAQAIQKDAAVRHAIQRTEMRFAKLLDAAPDAIVVVRLDGTIELVNEQGENLFGYGRGELLGQPLDVLLPERLRERHSQHVARFLEHPSARSMGNGFELLARRKDGSEFPIEVSLSPLNSDVATTVSAAIRDITQRKRTQRELELQADRFESAIESMQDGFALFDGGDELIRCNAAYRELLATHIDGPLLGRGRREIVDAWLAQLDAGLSDSAPQLRERWLDPKRTHTQAFDLQTREARSLRVMDRPTSHGDLVEVVWDLTEDERRAGELKLARAEAEAASNAKSEFLSSMSHELRTPLNAILGFAQLLMRDVKQPLTDRQRERVAQVLRGGEHLLRLIDDVLDLAKIESRRVSISAEPVSLPEVLAEVIRTLEPMARDHNIELRAEPIEPGFPRIFADRVRLSQILMNFGSNAIKYNHSGGHVAFRAERREGNVRIAVQDSGIGIPLAQQSKLFQPFQRAGQETGPIEGTGIGLAISRRLAELMGGETGFQSAPKTGSEFWVQLPPAAAPRMPSLKPSPTSVANLAAANLGLVLYIEDNPANLAFMQDVFQDLEAFRLVSARSAEEGILLARSLSPQIILLDVNLPGMSGIDALHALRNRPETHDIPVVALTAAASERDRRHGEQAGFFRYLTKPLDIDELMSTLAAAAAVSGARRVGKLPKQ